LGILSEITCTSLEVMNFKVLTKALTSR